MYVELGLFSICLSGCGLYYCVTRDILKKEDVELCMSKAEDKFNEFGHIAEEYIKDVDRNMTIFFNDVVNEVRRTINNEEEVEEVQNEESVELLVEEETSPISSPSSPSEISSIEEFILLSD